jgi:hypothetical protein
VRQVGYLQIFSLRFKTYKNNVILINGMRSKASTSKSNLVLESGRLSKAEEQTALFKDPVRTVL